MNNLSAITRLKKKPQHSILFFVGSLSLFLTPYWFLHLPGVNLSLADVGFASVFIVLVAYNYDIVLAQSSMTLLAVSAFFLSGIPAIYLSPSTIGALLNYIQYILIFLVVVPTVLTLYQIDFRRQQAIYLLSLSTSLVIVVVIGVSLTGDVRLHNYSWLYGNTNQLYWMVAVGGLLNLGLAFDSDTKRQIIHSLLVLACVPILIGGQSITALMIFGGGVWLLGGVAIIRSTQTVRLGMCYLSATGVSLLAIVWFVGEYWSFIYGAASVGQRIQMYQAAFSHAIMLTPWGGGIESAEYLLTSISPRAKRSVHNWMLAYWLEWGILAAVAFGVVLGDWLLVAWRKIRLQANSLTWAEVSAISVFAMYGGVIILFQPVPVNRVWWVFYALGAAAFAD